MAEITACWTVTRKASHFWSPTPAPSPLALALLARNRLLLGREIACFEAMKSQCFVVEKLYGPTPHCGRKRVLDASGARRKPAAAAAAEAAVAAATVAAAAEAEVAKTAGTEAAAAKR